MTNIFVRIFAQAIYMILAEPSLKLAICTWLHNIFVSVTQSSVTLINADFPRTSVEERMVAGPIENFAAKIAPQIVINLDNTVTAQYTSLLEQLYIIKSGQWGQVGK